MTRAIVFGGNGFIGYHLVHLLIKNGWEVTVYDRAIKSRFTNWEVQPLYVQGELGNRKLIREVLEKNDVVFHLAYATIPQTSNDDPAYDVQSNIVATVNMLMECTKTDIQQVVFLSSGGTVYGIPKQLPIPEEHVLAPICSYGITKMAIERYLYLFKYLYNLPYAILRPSNPFGEQQNYLGTQGVISVFLGRIAKNQPVEIWGDGSVVRDYFYVEDLARACLMAAECDIPDLLVNVGSGHGLSINDLLNIISDTLKQNIDVRYREGRSFDVPKLVLDISRSHQLLGWEPKIPLNVGIQRTWDWINQQINK